MDYYRDSVTKKSWELLMSLKRQFRFVLIGGWAVWLYTKQLKSKDIDLVIELSELEKLKEMYDISKNGRLRKYELREGEVDVDVYTPYYSNLGVPAEEVLADARVIEGFRVPSRELLFVLKAVAWGSRRRSAKGRKDLIDIVSLLQSGRLEQPILQQWVVRGDLKQTMKDLAIEINSVARIPELRLNPHHISKAKKQWTETLRFI